MKIYRVLCIAFFVLVSSLSFGQKNFKQGYIVTFDNENISGYIDVNSLDQYLPEIKFKKDTGSEFVKYNPLEVKFFNVSNRNFIGGIFGIETNTEEANESDNGILKDTMFVELLVTGKIKLFSCNEKGSKTRYFAQKSESVLIPLVNAFNTKSDTKSSNSKYRDYKMMLQVLMADISETQHLIKNVKYKKQPLIQLFEYYNSRQKMYIPDRTIREYSFSVIAGTSFVQHDFSSKAPAYMQRDEKLVLTDENPAYYSPVFGVDMIAPRYGTNRKFICHHQLLLDREKYTYNFTGIIRPEYYSLYHFSSNNYNISYKFVPRYNFVFKTSSIKPFVEVGLSVKVFSFRNNTSYREQHFYTEITNTTAMSPERFYGLLAGAGVSYHRFYTAINYENGWYKAISLKFGMKL